MEMYMENAFVILAIMIIMRINYANSAQIFDGI